ncbi:Post-GPI attachment to proteins factor 3, partial [Lunasporangiospora selenospora]
FIWGVVCLVPLLLHISYLAFIHFDYGYNMAATATVGVIHNLWWLGWSFANRKERPYAWEPTLGVMLVTAAMCLEILDFPPLWGIFDAHSLWHAATIPMIPLWYRFLLKDTEWEVRHMKGVLRSSYKD